MAVPNGGKRSCAKVIRPLENIDLAWEKVLKPSIP